MCLGIPMRIKSRDRLVAICASRGVEREVSLLMLQGESLEVGDYVSVSLGYAMQKIDAEQARVTWDLYDEMLAHDA